MEPEAASGDRSRAQPARVLVRDLARYCADLGWSDPLRMPEGAAKIPAHCASLESLAELMGGCTNCKRAARRATVVLGEGNPGAQLLLIGDVPGVEGDRTGRPFVGPAGDLLEAMIFALGFTWDEVYITNLVKCRRGDSDPSADEMAACAGFLERQIDLIRPQVIATLGPLAAQRLTGPGKTPSGTWASYRDIPLLPLPSPAHLLANQAEKRPAWTALKAIRKRLEK